MTNIKQNHDYYYPDDTTSDSTVTATVKDLSQHVTTEKRSANNNSNDWIDEIEHSFESSCNDNNYSLDNFNAYETTIMQSYLEPNCPNSIQQPIKQKSRFSVIKSKVKRAFCISSQQKQQQLHTDKQQILMQSSLPVLPTDHTRWNPSIDSSICSSSTLRPPDQTSTHSNNSNASSYKSYQYRHSCGFNNSSSTFITSAKSQQQKRRHSTVSRIKDRFSRTPSLGTLPISVPAPPIKGILKKHSTKTTTMRPPLPRPNSVILSADSLLPQQKLKRGSTARFSVYSNNQNTKKRYTVLSMMNNPNKRKSQPLNLPQQQGGRVLRFNKLVDIHETYAKGDYDRSSDPDAVCTRLTATIATQIKQELNYFKHYEMIVHDSSRIHTHYFL